MNETSTECIAYAVLLIAFAVPLVLNYKSKTKTIESVSCGNPDCIRCVNDKGLLADKTVQNASVLNISGITASPVWFINDLPFAYVKWLSKAAEIVRAIDFENLDISWQGSPNLVSDGFWETSFLCNQGTIIPTVVPELNTLLTHILFGIDQQVVMNGTSFSNVFFSRLTGEFNITPHCGATNTRLRCQFPIISSDDSSIRVATESHKTPPHAWFVFDDSYEHSVKSQTDSTRLTFIVDVWHPELTESMKKKIQLQYP